MTNRYATEPRRRVRHRRRSFLSNLSQSCLEIVPVDPRRAPLYLLVLGLGLVALPFGRLVDQHSATSADDFAPSIVEAPATPADASVLETSAATAPLQVMQAAPELRTYVVKEGDTLKDLAERLGVSVATIAAANSLADPDLISVGQEIIVPPTSGLLVSVSAAETLGQLASRHGVDLVQLATVNRVEPRADMLLVGATVVVPGIEPQLADSESSQPSRMTPTSRTISQEDAQKTLGASGEAGPSAVVDTDEQPVAQTRAPVVYEVQEGDNVRGLANRLGVSVHTILLANDLADPDLITVGTKLKVLPVSGIEHEVAEGESLAKIAAAYQVDLGPIVDSNGLANPDQITAGDRVVIPGATTKIVTVAAPAREAASPAVASAPAVREAVSPAVAPAPAAPKPAASTPPGERGAAKPATQAAVKPVAPASGGRVGARTFSARVTGYASGGGIGFRTTTGTRVHWGTVAVDPRFIPLGSLLTIEGLEGTFTAEDTGSAVRGAMLDVWFPDQAAARAWGTRTRQVTVMREGY